ncbi:unnamed protein product [Protopolystoma xenopodis]|uniref:Uncharacterized protein n=1 Tax=Protopolystoma xenopodis TaxID=117903 RepID=A0A3S5CLD5_9PLAT|nr:unnamed protein product [Protopolystoma xenopodis]
MERLFGSSSSSSAWLSHNRVIQHIYPHLVEDIEGQLSIRLSETPFAASQPVRAKRDPIPFLANLVHTSADPETTNNRSPPYRAVGALVCYRAWIQLPLGRFALSVQIWQPRECLSEGECTPPRRVFMHRRRRAGNWAFGRTPGDVLVWPDRKWPQAPVGTVSVQVTQETSGWASQATQVRPAPFVFLRLLRRSPLRPLLPGRV